jgi:hypothetical protein
LQQKEEGLLLFQLGSSMNDEIIYITKGFCYFREKKCFAVLNKKPNSDIRV